MSVELDLEATRYGKYELLKRIGMGGMAEVFLAKVAGPSGFEKQLVIKRVLANLRDDTSFIEMFLDEARLAARLSHPNICQVFDLGVAEGQYYIAMEHVQGQSLSAVIAELADRSAAMPIEAVLRIITQLLEALDYAHTLTDDAGKPLRLVHRDVTPSNVMVTPQGSVKLLDFGIARAATRRFQTQAGFARGKLGYMSPEQLQAIEMDGRADLFAVGSILYLLTLGQEPYAESVATEEQLRRMVMGEFPPPSQIEPEFDPDLEAIILKAMAPEPEDRYRSARAMQAAVESYSSQHGLSLGPTVLGGLMAVISGQAPLSQLGRGFDPNETREAQGVARLQTRIMKAPERARAPSGPLAPARTKPARASAPAPRRPDAPRPPRAVEPAPDSASTALGLPTLKDRRILPWGTGLLVLGLLAGGVVWWSVARAPGGTAPPGVPAEGARRAEPSRPAARAEPQAAAEVPGPTKVGPDAAKASPAADPVDATPEHAADEPAEAAAQAGAMIANPAEGEPVKAVAQAGAVVANPAKGESAKAAQAGAVIANPAEGEPVKAVAQAGAVVANPAKGESAKAAQAGAGTKGEPVKVVATALPAPVEPTSEKVNPKKAPGGARLGGPAPTAAPLPPLPVVGPAGTLTVKSIPSAKLKVDGRLLGSTPLQLTVAEGSHRVSLEYPGGPTHTLLVNVAVGRDTQVLDKP